MESTFNIRESDSTYNLSSFLKNLEEKTKKQAGASVALDYYVVLGNIRKYAPIPVAEPTVAAAIRAIEAAAPEYLDGHSPDFRFACNANIKIQTDPAEEPTILTKPVYEVKCYHFAKKMLSLDDLEREFPQVYAHMRDTHKERMKDKSRMLFWLRTDGKPDSLSPTFDLDHKTIITREGQQLWPVLKQPKFRQLTP